eukprot:COSAG06_NODE_2099_length_7600_cov_12.023730_1_plen_1115_part_10
MRFTRSRTQIGNTFLAATIDHAGDRAMELAAAGSFNVYNERTLRGPALRFELDNPADDIMIGNVCGEITSFLQDRKLAAYPYRLSIEYLLELEPHQLANDRLNRWFNGHQITRLPSPSNIMNRRIASEADLRDIFVAFARDREELAELYDFGWEAQGLLRSPFHRISQVRLIFAPPTIRGTLRAAGLPTELSQSLARFRYKPVEGRYGDCPFEAVLDVFPDLPQKLGAPPALASRKLKIEYLRRKAGLQHKRGEQLELEDLEQIEKRLTYYTRPYKGGQRECGLGFYIWDHRLHLRRIPRPDLIAKYDDPDGNYKFAVHIVLKDDHVHVWRDYHLIGNNLQRALSFFRAAVQVLRPKMQKMNAEWKQLELQLFHKTQELQPSSEDIEDYLYRKYKPDLPVDERVPLKTLIGLAPAGKVKSHLLWQPKKRAEKLDRKWRKQPQEKSGQPSDIRWIVAKGHRFRCSLLKLQPDSSQWPASEVEDNWEKLRTCDPQHQMLDCAWSAIMDNVITMDIETGALKDGKFITYSIAWMHGISDNPDDVRCLVAEDVDELGPGLMARLLQQWQHLADKVNDDWRMEEHERASHLPVAELRKTFKSYLRQVKETVVHAAVDSMDEETLVQEYYNFLEREDIGPGMYVYSYNGARFDNIEVLHSLIGELGHLRELQNYLKSNGRVISFTWKNLHFRDICLMTASSLRDAAKAYGVPTEKGTLPHSYMSGVESKEELLQRLHGTVSYEYESDRGGVRSLLPYVDWLDGVPAAKLQKRGVGQPYDEWEAEVSDLRKAQKKGTAPFDLPAEFSFKEQMIAYNKKDVLATAQVINAIGGQYADLGVDITTSMTASGTALKIFTNYIPMDIGKVYEEELYQRISSEACRGGFTSPIGAFHVKLPEDSDLKIWKIDKTSLYPGSTLCQPSAEDPTFQPLQEWWQNFPAPDGVSGWEVEDFGGLLMGRGHYNRLKAMYGFVRIDFDQRDMIWPAFCVKMEHGTFTTFAPTLEGSGYFAIPLVLYAFDRGCQIKLHAVDFVKQNFNPFEGYMRHYSELKNKMDALKVMLELNDSPAPGDEDMAQYQPRPQRLLELYLKDAMEGLESLVGEEFDYGELEEPDEEMLKLAESVLP